MEFDSPDISAIDAVLDGDADVGRVRRKIELKLFPDKRSATSVGHAFISGLVFSAAFAGIAEID